MADNERHFCICIMPENLSTEAQQVLAGRKAALLNEARWPAASVIKVKFLDGEAGPHRDIVVLNAGAALFVAGVAGSLDDGVGRAQAAIDSGAAASVLERLAAASQAASAESSGG